MVQKANQNSALFTVQNMTRKGGIPNTKLRGVTEADFFQKNNTADKGWTFNFDGSLVDFKKPKMRAIDEGVNFDVPEVIKVM